MTITFQSSENDYKFQHIIRARAHTHTHIQVNYHNLDVSKLSQGLKPRSRVRLALFWDKIRTYWPWFAKTKSKCTWNNECLFKWRVTEYDVGLANISKYITDRLYNTCTWTYYLNHVRFLKKLLYTRKDILKMEKSHVFYI